MSVQEEIQAVVTEVARCWSERDFDGLRRLWDRTDPAPVYVAEEGEPMFSHADIDRYWERTDALVERARMRVWNIRPRLICDEVTAVFYQMHWNIQIVGGRPPIGGDVRVSALLRLTSEGWRFFHYHEGPLAALTQLRRYNESQVDEGF